MGVTVERDGAFATVRLDRPDKHNGVNKEILHGVVKVGRSLRRDRTLRGVILAGNGPSFCAGADFSSLAATPRDNLMNVLRMMSPWANVFQQWGLVWRQLPVPVVACVQGVCFGAGIQLALAADFRIAAPDARFSVMESKWGLIPDMSGALTLRGAVREDVAKELTMTGRIFGAEEAQALGIVGRVDADPLVAARALLEEIAVRSPDAVAGTKALFHRTRTAGRWRTLLTERLIQVRLIGRGNQLVAVRNNTKKESKPYGPRKFS
ncbi:MAG: crotonase/enoyl-CoA hydratase family protein [Pseudomonadota bacterium]